MKRKKTKVLLFLKFKIRYNINGDNMEKIKRCGYELIVILFLLIQPILDMMAGFDFGIFHTVIRGLFFGFMIIYLLWNPKSRKWMIPYLLAIGVYFFYYFFYFHFSMIDTLNNTLKLFYLPVVCIFFYVFETKILSPSIAAFNLFLYVLLFVLSYVFGFGFNNYDPANSAKLGFRGVFNSINEISAIIIALLPVATEYILRKKKYIFLFVLYVLTIITSLLMGTKVTLGGIFIVILYFILPLCYKKWRNMTKTSKIITGVISLTGFFLCCYLFTFTTTFQNMVIQADFFHVESIFSIDFINRVLFNDRLSFLAINWQQFITHYPVEWLFGIGFHTTFKLVEIDFFDILFRYGIVGMILLFLPLIYLGWKVYKKNIYFFAFALLLLISCTSGHVLIYPAVAIYFGFLIFFCKNE